MLDDGSGYDKIGRAVSKRESMRRRVGNDLVSEPMVVAQLLLGNVQRDDQMRARRIDIGQERAFLAPADIEDDLPGPAVEQLRDFVLIKSLNVAREHRR